MDDNNWIGVDLDGTLALYDEWVAPDHIGKPIWVMVHRVQKWLADGKRVCIFTARISRDDQAALAREAIETWCMEHVGEILPITNTTDPRMIELWSCRCVQVEKNTGRRLVPVNITEGYNQ